MIPVVQFDPASLAIFAEIQMMALDADVASSIEKVIRGDCEGVAESLQKIANRKDKGRALQLASAFLHEKRHFHDFIATNYGAYRFRQFQELYANLPAIMQAGQRMNKLCLPLEVYQDPIRRRILNINDTPNEILAVADGLGKRRKQIEKDRKLYTSRFGTFEIGGEAQLEAMAYAAQSRFVSLFGGFDAHDAFSSYVFDREAFQAKYSAFINLGVAAGIVPIRQLEALSGREAGITHRAHLDVAILECILFASLQTDYVPNQDISDNGFIELSYPADRFAAITTKMAQDYKSLCEKTDGLDWNECWQAVNTVCTKIFGFSIQDQVARDIEYNEQILRELRSSADDVVVGVSEDFLDLRKAMHSRLDKAPEQVVSTEYFAQSVGVDVNPIVVLATSHGTPGEVPTGYVRLMGYDTSGEDEKSKSWRKWWWAAAIKPESRTPQPHSLTLKRPELSYLIIDSYAPMAKLILNGRRIRTLVGPELMFAEQRALAELSVPFHFYPGFEYPDNELPEEVLRFIRGKDELICDFSNEPIPRGEATVLTAWAMRRYPDLARYTIRRLGGTEMAYHSFIRNWSPWVVSRKMMEEIRPLMRIELPLI